jgi:hypothetical protein
MSFDATSTTISERQIRLVMGRQLQLGSFVTLWVQVPSEVTGINVRGRVVSLAHSGEQVATTIEFVFASEHERIELARHLARLFGGAPTAAS